MTICENEKDVSEILPRLWLGNYKSALSKSFVIDYNIKHIINLTSDVPNKFAGLGNMDINYLHVPVEENDDLCNKDLIKLFERITQYMYDALKNKEAVLVHCKRGHHRSAAIVAAFLIRYLNVDYVDAIKYINSIRHCALVRNTCMLNGLFSYYTLLSVRKQNKPIIINNGIDVNSIKLF